jgi:cell division protein FtsX
VFFWDCGEVELLPLFFSFALGLLFFFLHVLSFGTLFSQEIIQNFEKKADIPIVINWSASDSDIRIFREALENKKNEGLIVDYWELSRDEALIEFQKKYPAETSFLEKYDIPNPLSTVFGVVPSKTPGSTEELEEWIFSPVWHTTVDQNLFQKSADIRNRVERFLELSSFSGNGIILLQFLFLAISALLLLYSVFVLVRSHREEISVMRLVGARLIGIRIPFVLEGFLLSVLGLLLSIIFFWWFFFGILFLGCSSIARPSDSK